MLAGCFSYDISREVLRKVENGRSRTVTDYQGELGT